jgi:hypothetical protein
VKSKISIALKGVVMALVFLLAPGSIVGSFHQAFAYSAGYRGHHGYHGHHGYYGHRHYVGSGPISHPGGPIGVPGGPIGHPGSGNVGPGGLSVSRATKSVTYSPVMAFELVFTLA